MKETISNIPVILCILGAVIMGIKGVFGWPLLLIAAFLIKLVSEW